MKNYSHISCTYRSWNQIPTVLNFVATLRGKCTEVRVV
jgi:hypothetical protein